MWYIRYIGFPKRALFDGFDIFIIKRKKQLIKIRITQFVFTFDVTVHNFY